MKITDHAKSRMSQRAVTKEMIDFTLNFGEVRGDALYTNRKILQKIINELETQMRVAKKLLDIGGIVVISEEDTLITTYQYDSSRCSY